MTESESMVLVAILSAASGGCLVATLVAYLKWEAVR